MGLSFAVKKNCKINFQCRRKNVIMVVYGKHDCGPCPIASHGIVHSIKYCSFIEMFCFSTTESVLSGLYFL